MMATETAEILGQQLVIHNVGDAIGIIGTTEVVRARPDGQTLLLTSPNPIALMPSYRPNTSYRAEQLAPVFANLLTPIRCPHCRRKLRPPPDFRLPRYC
jgi:tripartite-type tricarboxylate transporter receptor subunit TctC